MANKTSKKSASKKAPAKSATQAPIGNQSRKQATPMTTANAFPGPDQSTPTKVARTVAPENPTDQGVVKVTAKEIATHKTQDATKKTTTGEVVTHDGEKPVTHADNIKRSEEVEQAIKKQIPAEQFEGAGK